MPSISPDPRVDLTVAQITQLIEDGFDSLSDKHASIALAVIDRLDDLDQSKQLSGEEYNSLYHSAVAQVA